MPDYRDLVIAAACDEWVAADALATDAFSEALTWRQIALVAIARYAVQQQRADRLEQRLRQVLGLEAWHPEEA